MRAAVLASFVVLVGAFGIFNAVSPAATAPSEAQMQAAFVEALARQVSNALDFAAETGGQDAVAAIRERGFDRFTVTALRKRTCRSDIQGGHVCEFAVDIDLVSGRMERVIVGRFVMQPDRLIFLQDV